MQSNLLREPNTSDEAVLRAELFGSLLENMEVWVDRLGNPAWVKGSVTGIESGTVTKGAAVFFRALDGRKCISFFELNESEEWRTSDILSLELYSACLMDASEAPTITLAKVVACTDWMAAKPMDGVSWQDASWAIGPPQPPQFYTLVPSGK